jgi:hypothetical protein
MWLLDLEDDNVVGGSALKVDELPAQRREGCGLIEKQRAPAAKGVLEDCMDGASVAAGTGEPTDVRGAVAIDA